MWATEHGCEQDVSLEYWYPCDATTPRFPIRLHCDCAHCLCQQQRQQQHQINPRRASPTQPDSGAIRLNSTLMERSVAQPTFGTLRQTNASQ
mmetsp:Transcript_10999/g.30383  ORF Transcript_10999/g.30383 Transcript_10999/m.30383 type:complete len:92 (+) Transcript_10999:505-780(+)